MAKATIWIPIKRHSFFLPLFRSLSLSLSNTTHLARLRVGKATHPSVDGRQGKEQEEECEHLVKEKQKSEQNVTKTAHCPVVLRSHPRGYAPSSESKNGEKPAKN